MDGHAGRQRQHVADEAFFGVYDLLALRLPDDEELAFWTTNAKSSVDNVASRISSLSGISTFLPMRMVITF